MTNCDEYCNIYLVCMYSFIYFFAEQRNGDVGLNSGKVDMPV